MELKLCAKITSELENKRFSMQRVWGGAWKSLSRHLPEMILVPGKVWGSLW